MSKEYDEYLKAHIGAVKMAAQWMIDHRLGAVNDLSDQELDDLMFHASEHDASKWCTAEYGPYDDYFYGEPNEDDFNFAWLHHIHHNPHHWQHWILTNGYGKFSEPGVVTAFEMPHVYALEMVADWWSFSWRSGNLSEIFDWYESHKDRIVLHESTREYVEGVLGEIREAIS